MDKNVKRFGEYLIDYRIIERHDLVIALEKQKLFGGKLGENLCDIGCMNPSALVKHLHTFKDADPSTDTSSV